MQCDTTRSETGSVNRTSPSSCTSPYSPTVSCLNPDVNSIRRPSRGDGDELTTHPSQQQLPQHHPSMLMPLLPSPCNKCGYSHPVNKCPAIGQQCYTCSGSNHFTALCRQKNRKPWLPHNTWWRGNQNPQRSAVRHRGCCSSCFPSRQSCHHHTPSHSSSHSPFP